MISFLKSLFVKKQNNVLFFDGDNISINVANVFAVERKNWDFYWVANKNATTPKKLLKNKLIEIVNPSCTGKESTDTFIAMDTVYKCANGATEIVIVSNDVDFIDVIVNCALMYPLVKFTLASDKNGASIKKNCSCELPKNATWLKFKMK